MLKRPVHCAEHFLELKICVSLQFCASDTPIPARRFIHQNINVPRTAVPCIPKCENARFATVVCTKIYESIGPPSRNEKSMVLLTVFWAIDTTFLLRGLVRKKKSEVLLQQFSAIDTTFLTRGLGTSRCNLRFATVLTIDNTFLAKRLISGWPFNTQGHSTRIHSMRIHVPVCIRNCNVCECQKHILAYHCISRNGEEYEYHCMSFHTIATRREWQ